MGWTKTGIVSKISNNKFYRDLALEIYHDRNSTERKYRVRTYNAFPDPDVFANKTRTSPYSFFDNPTGIWVNSGELIFGANSLFRQYLFWFYIARKISMEPVILFLLD